MLKILNSIVKSYRWYDRESAGKKARARVYIGLQVVYGLEKINVCIKLFILEVKTNQMQIMMLNTYPFEIQF